MPPRQADPDFRVELMTDHHQRGEFRCGVEALDRYLQNFAGQDSRKNASRTYIATVNGRDILGFYTLSAFSIELVDFPSTMSKQLPRYDNVPAVLLGRLAVRQECAGTGMGRTLLVHALRTSLGVAGMIGVAGVVVDAKDEMARQFYEKFNFLSLQGAPNSLFLPMRSIRAFEID